MGNISETTVSLRIFGKNLLPDEISELLGCKPTSSAKVGDDDPRIKREKKIVKEGYWIYEIEESSLLLEEKIEKLLEKMTDNLEIWKQLTLSYQTDIFCGIFLDDMNEGFALNSEITRKISDRNLKIDFDIYAP